MSEKLEVKLCALKCKGRGECKQPRKEGTLFCEAHQSTMSRLWLPKVTTSEDLEYMMQRDGERQ